MAKIASVVTLLFAIGLAVICLNQIRTAQSWLVHQYQIETDYVNKTEKGGFTQKEFNDFAFSVRRIQKDIFLLSTPAYACGVISFLSATLSLGFVVFGWRRK